MRQKYFWTDYNRNAKAVIYKTSIFVSKACLGAVAVDIPIF